MTSATADRTLPSLLVLAPIVFSSSIFAQLADQADGQTTDKASRFMRFCRAPVSSVCRILPTLTDMLKWCQSVACECVGRRREGLLYLACLLHGWWDLEKGSQFFFLQSLSTTERPRTDSGNAVQLIKHCLDEKHIAILHSLVNKGNIVVVNWLCQFKLKL